MTQKEAKNNEMLALQKYLLIGIIFGSALIFNPFLTSDVFEYPKLLVLIFGVGILSLVQIADFYLRNVKLKYKKIPIELVFLLIFTGAQVLGFGFSTNQSISLMGDPFRLQGFLTQIFYLLLFFNSWYFFARYPHQKTRSLFPVLIILLVVVSSLALLPYVFPMTFPFYFFTPAFFNDRVYGTFGNPNYLAAFLITLLPFLIFHKNLKKIIFIPSVVLAVAALFFTGSRSAWIASILVFLIYGIFRGVNKKSYKALGITLLITISIFSIAPFKKYLSPIVPQIERLTLDTERSTSLKTRVHLWKSGFQMFAKRPFTGYGQDMIKNNIEPFLPEYLKSNDEFFIDRTHSEFIDILLTSGIFGFLGYLGFFGLLVWKSIQKPMLFPALLALATLLIFHSVNFSTVSSNVLLYFLAGYLFAKTFGLPLFSISPRGS